MKRFKFPLRPVATVRAHRQLKAQQAFALGASVVARAEASLTAAQDRAAEVESMISAARTGPFRPDLQVSFMQAYTRERTAVTAAVKALEVARADLEKRRAVLIDAQRQLKVVEQLETKARAAYRLETLHAEQTEIDERAAAAAFHRKSPL